MSEQTSLEATIKVTGGKLKVGATPQPKNQFELLITNLGEAVTTKKKPFYLSLQGSLGPGEAALFLDETDARQCDKSKPDGWEMTWDFPQEGGIFRVDIFTYKNLVFKKNETVKISFSKVISKTDPKGSAVLHFKTDLSTSTQDLVIRKAADRPDILNFYSIPPEVVQNLPGESVTLHWLTYKVNDRKLTQVGISDPLSCDFSEDKGDKKIPSVSADMRFCLSGYDGSKRIDRELTVKVLRAGWYNTKNTILQGDPGYPDQKNIPESPECDLEPTLLLTDNDKLLYGIFRYQHQEKERAFLFQTENPFGGWKLSSSSTSPDDFPEGFSTSPGIYDNNKIWLIGGSQIDQQNTSIDVWYFNPSQSTWSELKVPDAKPTARMGHAVLKFGKNIWVMGGRDKEGNALNDVWKLHVDEKMSGIWTPLGPALWTPRCLINPVVFNEKIWLYGGAKEPSSAILFDDLYTCSHTNTEEAKWEKQNLTGVIKGSDKRTPIAACLQVVDGKLHLFGKFRIAAEADGSRLDEPLGFRLTDPSTGTWERFPSDGLATWGGIPLLAIRP